MIYSKLSNNNFDQHSPFNLNSAIVKLLVATSISFTNLTQGEAVTLRRLP